MKKYEIDYLKVCRKYSREEEIEKYGKLITTVPTKIKKSKKKYNRKCKHGRNMGE